MTDLISILIQARALIQEHPLFVGGFLVGLYLLWRLAALNNIAQAIGEQPADRVHLP